MTTPAIAETSYTVRAHTLSHGTSEAALGRQTLVFDTSPGGDPALPGPAEMLCAAFAACLLKNVERFSRILPFAYEEATVEVVAWRQDSPPRFTRIRYDLRMQSDEPEHRVDLLHRNLRKHGTVYNTLAATCDVDGVLHAAPPA